MKSYSYKPEKQFLGKKKWTLFHFEIDASQFPEWSGSQVVAEFLSIFIKLYIFIAPKHMH